NFQEGDTYEKMQFYYHPDHLGSSSYITNLDGEVVQHIEYVPFGEVFVEERNNIWNTPYLFNAKEFDEETGLYYYGARYYEPKLGIWISTDPKQEKYFDFSSYCYTGNNPIRFSDPNGQDWWDKVKGFGAAIVDNATGGLINIRTYAGRNVSAPKDFNAGLTAGDLASLTVGTIESGTGATMVASGTTITTVGLVAEGPSLGTSTVVVVVGSADATVGAGLTVHGAVMMSNARKNLTDKKGHIASREQPSVPQYSNRPPGKTTKLRNGQGWKDKDGNVWKKDLKHKDHWDVTNPKTGKKVKEIDYNGQQIWPNGPKNKNKK
uniref:RHS repeat domain-containing protein n=1 Tax=Bacteroides sp. OF04-15BH TaxID=2292281 RepID=UPI000FF56FE2